MRCFGYNVCYYLSIIWYLLEWWRNACSDWLTIEVIFASTEKLYCDVKCISTTSKVGNNPALIRVRMIDFFVEIKWKLNDKKWMQYFFGWSRYQPKKEWKTFATMRYAHWCSFPSCFGRYLDQPKKNIRFIS